MLNERPPKGRITDTVARSFGKLSRLWRPLVSPSININSRSEDYIAKADAQTDQSANTTQEYRSTSQTSVETFMARSPAPFASSLSVDKTRVPLADAFATMVVHTEVPKISPISVPSISAMLIQSRPETSLAYNTHSPLSPSLPDPVVQMSPELEQNPSNFSGLGLFSNAQNSLITGGTFNNIVNIFPADKQMKIPMLQKPNSSLEGKIFLYTYIISLGSFFFF